MECKDPAWWWQIPERRTALLARELKRYNIDVVALSETGLAGELGFSCWEWCGLNLFLAWMWGGASQDEGCGFCCKILVTEPGPWSANIYVRQTYDVEVATFCNSYITFISAYAPSIRKRRKIMMFLRTTWQCFKTHWQKGQDCLTLTY